ncbi:hypothetical protein KAR91_18320 [Candidatus Pacearchaeota archaeon]|nr:hypothetical protein [Candidatus Pacearchaeota archaeon]
MEVSLFRIVFVAVVFLGVFLIYSSIVETVKKIIEVMLKKIDKKLIGEELLIIKGNCFYKDKNKSSDKSIIKKINDGDAELVAISISEKERWEVFLNSIDEVTPTKNHGEKDEYTS